MALPPGVSGYEVIRNGQTMSVTKLLSKDIVLKTIWKIQPPSGGRGGGGGGVSIGFPGGGGVQIGSGGEVEKVFPPSTPTQDLSKGYLTKQGYVPASVFAQQAAEKARARQFNIQAYQQWKGTESKYLGDVQKRAYENYLATGMSAAQARYMASQWRRGQEKQIKAQGGIVTYETTQPITEQPIISISEEAPTNIFKEFAVGETGKRFIGFGWQPLGITSARPQVTAEKIKTRLQEGKLPFKVVAEFIPTTPLEVGIYGGTAAVVPFISPMIRIPIGAGISAIEIKRALNPERLPEQRIASGIIGTLAGVGTIAESMPFIRGGIAKISPQYKSVQTQPEGFKAIVGVKGAERIGLIEPKAPLKIGKTTGVQLPSISPLKKGGFGVTPSQKSLFLGEQTVATSQRGLFQVGKEIPLKKEFFVTPQEPFIKIPETRISRLGLTELTKIPKEVQIGFGLPQQPQIGIMRGTIGRIETPTQFVIGKGTELEAIKTFGTITDITKLGVTTIKGQAVNIFGFKIGKGFGKISPSAKSLTTEGTARVSGELTLGITGAIRGIISKPTITTTKIMAPTKLTLPSPKLILTYPTYTIKPTTPTRPTGRISTPKPITTSPFTPPKFPTTKPIPPSKPTIPISKPNYLYRTLAPVKPPIYKLPFLKGLKLPKQTFGKFPVLGRRFGKFRIVGVSGTEKGAFSLGKKWVSQNLGATFKIPLARGRKLPGYITKFKKGEVLYIEPKGRRLKRVPYSQEVPEIQLYKKAKRRNMF